MLVHILSIFPEFFSSPLNESMIKRAQEKGKVKIDVVNMRDFAKDKQDQNKLTVSIQNYCKNLYPTTQMLINNGKGLDNERL